MNFKNLVLAAVLAASTSLANAQNVMRVTETFASGAVFSGLVTFTSNFDNVTAVDGYLSGGGYGRDHINWIWDSAVNFSDQPNQATNFLMDGTGRDAYGYFVTFTWDYSAAPKLVFSALGYGNNANSYDTAIGGTITAVPEPETYAMLLAGLGLLGFAARKRKRPHV